MLTIKIDNPEIENRFEEYVLQHKRTIQDVVNEAIKLFLDMQKKDDTLVYIKKDPMKHMNKIKYEYDDDLCDDVALTHIEDSGKYIHDLRKQKRDE